MVLLGAEFIVATILVALVFDFFNGMNDSANSTATIIATRVLKPVQAIILAATFNFLGPFFGAEVAKTVGKGIVSPDVVTPELILGALVGAIAWTWLATHNGIPISVSHSLIGGLVGAGLAAFGAGALDLPTRAAMSPVFATMRDGAIAGVLIGAILSLLAGRRNVLIPALLGAFLASGLWLAVRILLGHVTVKGLFATILFIAYSPMLGFVGAYLLSLGIAWIFRRAPPARMKRWFGILQLASASFYSFSHGTNDGQKTMGILMALTIAAGWYGIEAYDSIPLWIILASAGAIALGTLLGGFRVVHTMGMRLTHLEPHQGFAAETSSAVGLYFLAAQGVPVSTTHSITGSIMGVGAIRGAYHVSWKTARGIVLAWLFTIPASATVAALAYWILSPIVQYG